MDIFSALSEPTRREIIEMLAKKGQLSATAIAENFDSSPPAISQHLRVLRETKVVTVEKKAQQRFYRLNPKTMSEIEHWAKKLAEMWSQRFDRLETVIEEEKKKILNSYNNQLNKKKG